MAAKGAKRSNNKGKKRKLENNPEEILSSKEKKINSSRECEIKSQYGEALLEKYGVEFPDDLFWFYEYIAEYNKDSTKGLLELLELNTTGPFDILNGKITKDTELSKIQLHLHGRHYTDTPEMTTVLYSNKKNGLHIAYYRDTPSELPSFVVCCKDEHSGELVPYGDNLFAAIFLFIKELIKKTKEATKLKTLRKISELLEERGKKLGYDLDVTSSKMKRRNKEIVTKSFNKIGLVVPVDKAGVGYRELHHSDRELRKLLDRIATAGNEEERNRHFDELQETITFVQFANDECDYGMGLELGIDLFVYGNEIFHGVIQHLLPLAYQLLARNLYSDILEAHLADRQKKGPISVV